ncbi:MAG: GIY-YIG nuclease family protein [Acidobacteriota bacterium]
MSSDTDNSGGTATGLPFTRPVVRRITEELFRERSQWKSGELVDRIAQIHHQRGGSLATDPGVMVRRVLQDLKHDGLVTTPGHGWWRWTTAAQEERPVADEEAVGASSPVEDEAADVLEPTIRVEKEVGAGAECVYLYFNPNDRRLAELEGRDVWECKIGRTGSADAANRILGQGIKTALSRLPTVGLLIRTDDSAALENALHSSLRLVGAEVPDSPGNEWFVTSPARIEAWQESFQKSLAVVRVL